LGCLSHRQSPCVAASGAAPCLGTARCPSAGIMPPRRGWLHFGKDGSPVAAPASRAARRLAVCRRLVQRYGPQAGKLVLPATLLRSRGNARCVAALALWGKSHDGRSRILCGKCHSDARAPMPRSRHARPWWPGQS
jgi:hypothetical protein